MFTAGAQAQAYLGLVQHKGGYDQQHEGQGRRQVKGFENSPQHKTLAVGEAGRGGCDAHPSGDQNRRIALSLDGPGEHDRKGGRQHVEGSAADGLVGLEVDGGKGQQKGKNHARSACHQDSDEHRQLRLRGTKAGQVKPAHDQAGHQRANDHDALQGDVDDARALGEHTPQGHQQQRDGKEYGRA